jgi:ferredoxin-NADP reductase
MAVAKTALVASADILGPKTRHLVLEMEGGAPLGFAGGQYIIVDSGIVLPGGKIAKRAYSIASADAEQARFELAVRRLETGPGSNYMHELSVGATVKFSGPWGKFVVSEGDEPGPVLVVATDTGITAALGLVQARAFQSRLSSTTLVWLRESDEDFVTETFARRRVPSACAEFQVGAFPPVGHPERALVARACVRRFGGLARAFFAGDGDVIGAMSETVVAAGLAEHRIAVECFFNNPAKKAA